MAFPVHRPRRLRRTPALRALARETTLVPTDLIAPLFVKEGIADAVPIGSMPGQSQHTVESLRKTAAEIRSKGVLAFLLFGVPEHKDAEGTQAWNPDGITQQAIRALRDDFGDDALIVTDLCLDEYTDHGHCGVLAPDGTVDNDATLERYAEMALVQAEAGAHVLGTSGMMDGQVGAARTALDGAGRTDVAILAYAVKYASGFFGPFREAVGSSLRGDRKAYQQDPANLAEALREAELDVAEGADMIMVKPAMAYLDVVRVVADTFPLPVAAYQVSGEYAMVEAAAANGWIDRDRVI